MSLKNNERICDKVASMMCLLFVLMLSSCMSLDPTASKMTITRPSEPTEPFNVSVSNVQVSNNQIIITGTNLTSVTQFKINEGTNSNNLQIESKTSTTLVANTINNVTFAAGKVFDFILANASAASTFTVNFSLCDSTLGGKAFACALTPNDRDVLSYNAGTGKWEPRSINGLSYQGTFSAAAGLSPTAVNIGDYYIISVAGTISGVAYHVHDWIVLSAVGDWEKIDNSNTLTSIFGRTGVVTATKNDYSLTQMSDVDLTSPTPVANQSYLKWNGSNWVAAAIVESDPNVSAFAKTTLPTCTAGQVLKSDGTSLSCITDQTGSGAFTGAANFAMVTNGSGGPTTSSVTSTELGYLSGVTSAIQTQLNARASTAGSASIITVGTVTNGVWNGTTVDTAHGGTGSNITAVQGGMPYFSSVSTMATSAQLLLNGIVLGGGSASAPGTIGLGTSGQFLTSAGVAGPPVWISTVPVASGGTGTTSTSQNFVFAGPTSGAGAPGFRGLVTGDLPIGIVQLSSLGAATVTSTIDNLLNAQIWNWSTATTQSPLTINANGLTTGSLLNLSTSNNSVNSTNGLLNVVNTGSSTNGILARLQSNSTAASGLTVLTNGNVGIGTTAPGASLEIAGSGEGLYITRDAGNAPDIRLKSSRGTVASPTAKVSGDPAGEIHFQAYDGSTYLERASFKAQIDGTVSAGSVPTAIVLFTGSTNKTERMRIDSAGNVGIGTWLPNRLLEVAGPIRVAASLLPSSPLTGDIAIDSAASNALKWYNGTGWQAVGTGMGNVTSVTSTGGDIGVANGTTTPNLAINSGTGIGQFLKFSSANQLPALDGSLLTSLNPANLSSVVSLAKGGTGANITPANGGIVYSNASTLAVTPAGLAGYILTSAGAGTPNWTATLPVVNGGTGISTLTTNGVLLGNTTSPVTVTPVFFMSFITSRAISLF